MPFPDFLFIFIFFIEQLFFIFTQMLSIGSFGRHDLQCSPFIMLSLESIEMGSVLSELCYKETILQMSYRKMIIVIFL